MKRTTKIISVLLAIMILSVLASINVFATQTSQDGLEVQIVTDKESYTVNENIKTTITVKNTNDYEISNLSIKSNMPDGLALVDGDTSLTQESLKSNESANLVFTSKVISEEKETDPPTTQKPTNTATNDVVNQDNNDSTTIKTGGQPIYTIIVSVLFFISALAVTIVVFINRKNRTKFKSTISMILCLTIVGTSFIGLNVFNAKATEISQNTKSFEVSKNVKVDNTEYKISATFSYDIKGTEITPTTPDSDDIQLTIDQNDFTTTESLQTITGSFKSNIDESIIAYEIQSIINKEVVSEFGNAEINENKYVINNLRLIPGNNKIIVSIVDGENKILSKEINIFYDRGSYHEVDNNHIKIDKDTGVTYIDNIILLYFEDDIDEKKKHEIISSINGNVVGHLNAVDQYQIEVKSQTLNELISLCEELENNEFVYTASPDIRLDMSVESQSYIPNDPWTDSNEIINWDENNPSGNNWWAESIKMPSTWYFNDVFKTINIGVIDDGFDENHKDLNIKYIDSDYQNNNVYNDHGTHVTGIISAKHDNTYGISGVVDNCNIYAMPVNNKSNFLSSSLVNEISELIEYRCKVINISMAHPSGGGVFKSYLLNKEQRRLTKALGNLLDNKYDFLISKAAGNKGKDTSDDLTIVLSQITENNIKDRIIVVANATITNNGDYILYEDSNYGKRIDIVAPGTNIYSTKVNGYTYMTGTSQAAPMVTGVAGLVWSINPNFTGAEVKKIVCDSVNTSVSNNPNNTSDNLTYKLLNAKLSVENAIEKTYGNLYNCYVKFVDTDTQLTIPAKCTIYKTIDEDTQEFEKYRYIDYCETFNLELPNGVYRIDVTPLDENHEATSISFTQNNSGINSLVISIDKKVVQPEESDFLYRIENDEVIITGYKGTGGDILIPFYIEDKPVVMIDEKAFYENNTITSVTFEGNLDSIGSYAFAYCNSLKSVSIKGMVTDIKSYAFNECSNLTLFFADEGVINISQGAFASCKKLSDFGIQNKIEYIGNMAFFSCESLYDFDYPKGANVNKYAFMGTNTKYKNDWIKI